jgi:hypothetical protein
MSLIFPINDLYKDEKKNIKNENLILKDILNSRNELFLKEYYKILNIHFSATCKVKAHLLFHEGRIMITDKKLLVIKKTTKKNVYINSKERKKYLTQQKLEQYNISHPLVSLDFDLISAHIITFKSQKKFNIIILGSNNLEKESTKTIYFSMENSSDKLFNEMIQLISKAIYLSRGFKYNLFEVSLRKYFYKDYFLKVDVFEEIAKTGDILLFRGFQKHSKCQRSFTGADYDHVALIVRQGLILYVYESTGNDGVKLRNWRDFRVNLWNLLYDKMTFRQLIVDKDKINVQEFEKNKEIKCNEFIKMTKGMKYTLSGCGFCCKCNMKKYGKDKKWGEYKGYFCSQLVAAAYNHMGLLTDEIDIGYYLPGSFSKDYDLELKNGIELSVEYIIDFSE